MKLLTPHELEQFFNLHWALMFFANQRLNVIPNKVTTSEEFAALPPDVRIIVRDAVNDKGIHPLKTVHETGRVVWREAKKSLFGDVVVVARDVREGVMELVVLQFPG